MSYVERRSSIPIRLFWAVGIVLGLMWAAYLALLLVLWFQVRTVEYVVFADQSSFNNAAQLAALSAMNSRVHCELWGRPVERGGKPALRFRFPADPDLEEDVLRCIRRAAPKGYKIEKASWLETKLHAPKPSWL